MKNKIKILTTLIGVLLLSKLSYSQVYYSFNEKIQLNETEKYSIQLSSNMLLNNNITNLEFEEYSNNIIVVKQKDYEESFDKVIGNNYLSKSKVYTTDDGLELVIFNEILCKLKDNLIIEWDKHLENISYKIIKKRNRYVVKILEKDVDILSLSKKMFETGNFEYCYPNFISKITFNEFIPNDEYFSKQFYLKNTGQVINDGHSGSNGADIKATFAWDITKGNNNVIIAVIDQGVTSNHPDLPNSRQVRINGSNFSGNGNINNPSPVGNDNHGNACAGIIAAEQNNGEGVSGICPECKIMPIRIFGSSDADDLADAIEFASDNGSQIISNSWGYNSYSNNLHPVIIDAIDYAINNGSLVVFAAGNTANHANNNAGYVNFPSNINRVGMLCVGASNRNDLQANYSPTSSLVEIVAPSHNAYPSQISGETSEVWTIDIPGNSGYNPCNSSCDAPMSNGEELPNSGINFLSYTGRMGGTSSSCPQVAAVAGLMLSLDPCLSPNALEQMLLNTADKVGGVTYNSGKSNEMGFGRLNAEKALQQVLNSWLLQNYTETGNLLVASQTEIRAGENVTNTTANLPYIIASGADVELKATQSITLEPGFKAYSGSNFLAHIEAFNGDCNQWNSKNLWFQDENESIETEISISKVMKEEESIFSFDPLFFPNPYNEALFVKYELEQDEEVTIQLFDLSGKNVYTQSFKAHSGQNMHLIEFKTETKVLIAKTCVNDNCKTAKLIKSNEK